MLFDLDYYLWISAVIALLITVVMSMLDAEKANAKSILKL